MAPKKGLGKGLDSLIAKKTTTEENVSRETLLNINQVEPNPNQPRKRFNEDKLQELADSIKVHGIIQPLVVQKENDRYIIIAGERRWRAARLAGVKEVPVVIRDFTEQELYEVALIENIQRQDLDPIEEANAYSNLIKEHHLTQDEVAERVSKSRVTITNSLRLLKLDPRVQQMVIDELLTGGHARALISIEDPEEQYNLANRIFDEKLSVRETEKLVKKILHPKAVAPDEPVNEADEAIYRDIEENLKTIIGSKVKIMRKPGGKGNIEIEYYSTDELDRILDLLRSVR